MNWHLVLLGFSMGSLVAGYRRGPKSHWGSKIYAIVLGAVALVGGLLIVETKTGVPADISKLDNGIYAVYGKMEIGEDIALWVVPLDSPKNLEHGKLYKLHKGTKTDFGPFLKKDDNGELLAYSFGNGK